jgi:8-oxo-dGTP pyrophosphatase MutT (NUDIX family)
MSSTALDFELFRVEDKDGWKKVSALETYADPYIQIERAQYLTPGRRVEPVTWTVAHRKSAVAVAPVLEDGRFVLISQERLPVQRVLWEFPAGQIDEPEGHEHRETIVDTALRELREESGCELAARGALEPLGYFLPSQGFTTEHVYLFRASPVCVVSRPEPDGSEHISDVRFVSAEELRRMIAENEITNALTLALYARMSARGMV